MNIKDLHQEPKAVSAKPFFKSENGIGTAIRLERDALLKEHTTPVIALLICISGQVVYEDENGIKVDLQPGDFYQIQPQVKHWLHCLETAHLVLFR